MGDLLPELPPEKKNGGYRGREDLAVYEGARKNMEKSLDFSFFFFIINMRS